MTEQNVESDIVNSIVGRVLRIEDITRGGGPNLPFAWRFRGHLVKDSVEAYDQLSEALKPYRMTPIFREEDERHTILLVDGVIEPAPSNAWINLVLFLVTLVSVLMAGVLYSIEGPLPGDVFGLLKTIIANLPAGIPFGVSLLAILLTHEFGHYLAARYHKVAVTLPYFIPFLSGFGTMGAFIQLKEPPKNKRVLHDIGIAGPLAGLVVAIPILVYGIALSPVEQLPSAVSATQGFSLEGNSILYLLIKYLVHGELLPAPASYGSVNPVWYWIKYFFTGMPTPLGGRDVFLHPMAWAGWAGLLVTGLNLIPVGQLDGGHILYVLFGKQAKKAVPVALAILFVLGFVWSGWWIWAALIFILGRRHAEPLDQITQLDPPRKILAIFALVIFVLVFIPVPLQLIAAS
jgi:hypothetical protein